MPPLYKGDMQRGEHTAMFNSKVHMKKFSASVCAIAAAALLTSSLSFADNGGGGRPDEYQRRGHGNGNGHGPRWDDRRTDQRDGRWNDRRPEYNARGPEFRRGGYIPYEYRRPNYVVDYRVYHLSPPPRGQQWVQVGADYVLIAVATGLIANIILNN